MAILTWLGFVFFLGYTHCYDNLSRQPNTIVTLSSVFGNHPPTLAKDGNNSTKDLDCSHTGLKDTKAWFQVDLGKQYSLNNVKIFYRKEGDGPNDWKQYRFRQFNLDVSNVSVSQRTTAQRTRCYKDNTTHPALPPNIIDIQCKQIARYVIVETMYVAPEKNNNNEYGPILEICEIEVYGCSVHCNDDICNNQGYCTNGCEEGYWWWNCQVSCPENCKDQTCHISNGSCIKCIPNWAGTQCNICDPNHYGNDCSKECNNNCIQGECSGNYGSCTHGCKSGFYGDLCNSDCLNCPTGCDRYSGRCFGDCPVGKFGKLCDNLCNEACENVCFRDNGTCTSCHDGLFGDFCDKHCSSCLTKCDKKTGKCIGDCPVGKFGNSCENTCNQGCANGCLRDNGTCKGCPDKTFGDLCDKHCSSCLMGCDRNNGRCIGNCPVGKFGNLCDNTCNQVCANGCLRDTGICNSCVNMKFGEYCNETCNVGCASTCDRKNGSCVCLSDWYGETCHEALRTGPDRLPMTEIGTGIGAILLALVVTIVIVVLIRRKRQKDEESKQATAALYTKSTSERDEDKSYINLGSITVAIEDPDEEPQLEKPEECVYYNNLSVAKDIPVSDLLYIITTKQTKENEGFLKEYKSLPYGERFPCEVAKSEENMPKNRFKTTFPYDHSRVVLESSKEFNSDYINANYIENMDGKREFIASQGPRANTVVDHWRMIWQEHINYIVMLTNLIEGPKVKCHRYWPDVGKEMDVDPFFLTLLEEKVYAYYVIRKIAVRKRKVTGSRTVVQFHYTRWPDHGTPDPLNLVDFLRHFRHKIKPSHHPILVHCSAGIGRTGTFIALDVLSRYGKVKGKINVIEYVKAMRKDRMTMIQNVDQYVFLYHALYEFFKRSGQFVRKDDFLSEFANLHKADTKKQLSDEFNELASLKTKYEAKDYRSGKKHQKLNASKSVLPVEKYLVYLTSHIAGRETYYNAVNVSSFTQAEELISAQFPVAGAAIDLVRLLIDEDCSFLVSLNPLSEVKELKDWVNDKIKTIKLDPFEITKHAQTELSPDIRKTSLKIKGKEDDILGVEVLECMSWSSSQTVPADKSILINFIKEFCFYRKSYPDGRVAVLSKDGAVGCGVFCAVYNAVQQIQQDIEVDMFTIVRQLQVRRPEMISTVEEYELCYDAVHQFLASDSVYANT